MGRHLTILFSAIGCIAAGSLVLALSGPDRAAATTSPVLSPYLVQADSFDAALAAVGDANGEITHELRIIDAVGALLSHEQRERSRTGRAKRCGMTDMGGLLIPGRTITARMSPALS